MKDGVMMITMMITTTGPVHWCVRRKDPAQPDVDDAALSLRSSSDVGRLVYRSPVSVEASLGAGYDAQAPCSPSAR